MLAWALWLAASLLRWVSWAWTAFSAGGTWPVKPVTNNALAPADEGVGESGSARE
jgi:hypothetical protein